MVVEQLVYKMQAYAIASAEGRRKSLKRMTMPKCALFLCVSLCVLCVCAVCVYVSVVFLLCMFVEERVERVGRP